MSTINGVGTGFNGFSQPDEDGNITATKWFTVLYFPVLPLWKAKLKRQLTTSDVFQYQLISYEKMNAKEILTTYIYGWLFTPVLFFWPLVLSVREVAAAIGIPTENAGFGIYEAMITFSILYLVIFVWKWKDWMEERGLPKNYKELLKQQKMNKQ
ncbi:MAG: hypothetical protein V4506_02410 [Bacteroidota bacterium]